MRKRKHTNLALLVFCHLLLFAYPVVSKSFHVHKLQQKTCCDIHENDDEAINQSTEDCPICDYELLSFVNETPFSSKVYQFSYPVLEAALPDKVQSETILFFSLRAPPAA